MKSVCFPSAAHILTYNKKNITLPSRNDIMFFKISFPFFWMHYRDIFSEKMKCCKVFNKRWNVKASSICFIVSWTYLLKRFYRYVRFYCCVSRNISIEKCALRWKVFFIGNNNVILKMENIEESVLRYTIVHMCYWGWVVKLENIFFNCF